MPIPINNSIILSNEIVITYCDTIGYKCIKYHYFNTLTFYEYIEHFCINSTILFFSEYFPRNHSHLNLNLVVFLKFS